MKQFTKRILSFVLVACMAFIGVITTPFVTAKAASTETLTIKGTTGVLSSDKNTITWTQGNVEFKNEKASSTTAIRTSDSAHYRVYVGSQTTISTKDGSNITDIVISCVSSYVCKDVPNGTTSGTTITVSNLNSDSLTFKTTKQWRLTQVKVTYAPADTSAPTISLSGDDYMQVGDDLTLTDTSENLTEAITWTSSDTTIAEVDEDGIVTGNKMGKVTITASANGVEAKKDVTVYPVANSELTIAQAIEVCKLTGNANAPYTYSATGVVEEFSYDDKYTNYTATISDGENSIKAFGMTASALHLGDTIKVTGSLINFSENTPEFNKGCTCEILESNAEIIAIVEALNAVDSYMSLSYKYTQTTQEVEVAGGVTDTLNSSVTGITGGSYTSWNNKTASSSAVYAGVCAGKYQEAENIIQLNNNNNKAGVVTTVSGGKATKISVVWNAATASGRTLNIYGSNTAYTASSDLYDSAKQGTLLGTIVYGTSTELEITGDYEYIGFTSNKSALYLDEVQIEWNGDSEGGIVEKAFYSNSAFNLRCGVDASLTEIANVDAFGILVKAGDNEIKYTADATTWTEEGGLVYVVISLGDIINDLAKLGTEFTVQAYVEYDGNTIVSESTKTHSVASLIDTYNTNGENVSHLYNYLVEKGLI